MVTHCVWVFSSSARSVALQIPPVVVGHALPKVPLAVAIPKTPRWHLAFEKRERWSFNEYYPIVSRSGIFTYMNGWFFMVNVGKYTSSLDPMGIRPFFLADGCKAAGCFSTLIHCDLFVYVHLGVCLHSHGMTQQFFDINFVGGRTSSSAVCGPEVNQS